MKQMRVAHRTPLGRCNQRSNVKVKAQSVSQSSKLTPEQVSGYWDSFSSSVEGEWSGKSASFSNDGTPLPLPERYVPPEYSKWGIELSDWSTLASMKVTDGVCTVLTKHMFPTVGCEADAASFVERVESFSSPSSSEQPRLYIREGSYSSGPPSIPSGTGSFAIESCLSLNTDQRVRMRLSFDRYLEEKPYKLQQIELISEAKTGAYNGGRELPHCCGFESGFSAQKALDAACLDRVWTHAQGLTYEVKGNVAACREATAQDVWSADATSPVCLPLDTWLRLNIDGDRFEVEAGLVLPDDQNKALISRRTYVDSELVSVTLVESEAS